MLNRTLVDRVYEHIKRTNSSEFNSSVAVSDQFFKEFASTEGYSDIETKHALLILGESHKIFTITISKENRQQGIKKLEAYVVADADIISSLKREYQRRLVEVFNKERNGHFDYSYISKYFLSNLNNLANTPGGRLANIAIMLNEYYNLIVKDPSEFTDDWQEEKLKEYIRNTIATEEIEAESTAEETPAAVTAGEEGHTRAVDSPEYDDYSKDEVKLQPEKVLKIYGAEFFFRVKLRRYEFGLLREMVHDGQIKRKADLLSLRNMLRTIKNNFDRDTRLNDYFQDIFHLDREVSKRLYFTGK